MHTKHSQGMRPFFFSVQKQEKIEEFVTDCSKDPAQPCTYWGKDHQDAPQSAGSQAILTLGNGATSGSPPTCSPPRQGKEMVCGALPSPQAKLRAGSLASPGLRPQVGPRESDWPVQHHLEPRSCSCRQR